MAGEGSDRNPESRHLNIIKAKINQTDFQTTRLQMVTKRKAGSLDDVLIGSWEPEAL